MWRICRQYGPVRVNPRTECVRPTARWWRCTLRAASVPHSVSGPIRAAAVHRRTGSQPRARPLPQSPPRRRADRGPRPASMSQQACWPPRLPCLARIRRLSVGSTVRRRGAARCWHLVPASRAASTSVWTRCAPCFAGLPGRVAVFPGSRGTRDQSKQGAYRVSGKGRRPLTQQLLTGPRSVSVAQCAEKSLQMDPRSRPAGWHQLMQKDLQITLF